MASSIKVSTKGMDDSLEALAQMGRDVDEAAANALLTGCEVMQEEMISLAPELTGNLKAHILIDGPNQDGNFITAEVGVIHKKGMTDAETARYANAQEYGTSSMAANPYIRPGAERSRGRASRAMRDVLAEELKR